MESVRDKSVHLLEAGARAVVLNLGVNFIFQGGKFTEQLIATNVNFYKSF